MTQVQFTLNGRATTVDVGDDELLLDTLRKDSRLTSVRYSCGIGVCGTCTVMLDGRAVSSCLQLTQMVSGSHVQTAESVVGEQDSPHRRVLDAFVSSRAFQCSYCIPAMALTVAALLDAEPEPTPDTIRQQLGGNLCRCGSYPQIVEAVTALLTNPEQQ